MKIVVIGGGSAVFGPAVLHDAIVDHRLAGAELALVDADGDLARLMTDFGRALCRATGVDTRVVSTTERRQALPGADFVIFSAAIQAVRRWETDAAILRRHGLADQVRECGGLGGLAYSLRAITLAIDVARDMERLCPNAMFLDCANPMPRVVTAIHRFSSIAPVGFCNAAWGGPRGYSRIAGWLGRGVESIAATTAGLNHFAWALEVRDRETGADLLPALKEKVRDGGKPEFEILGRWLDQTGAVGASGAHHMAEFLPPEPGMAYRDHALHGDEAWRRARRQLLRDVADGNTDWRAVFDRRSWERPVDVAVALAKGAETSFDMVNFPNDGCIREIPEGRIVEAPAFSRNGRLIGRPTPSLPAGVAQWRRAVSDVHELVAEGAVRGDRALLEQAVEIDPAIPDKDAARPALAELVEAHRDLLPQFAR